MKTKYNDITKELYVEILLEESIITDEVLTVFQTLYELPDYKCVVGKLVEILSWSGTGAVNGRIVQCSKKVAEKYNIDLRKKGKDKFAYWDVFFHGYATSDGFIWVLRDNLRKALVETGVVTNSQAYLFAWNPKKWIWKNIEEQISELERGQQVVQDWSCQSYKSIRVNDRAFVTVVGQDVGVFASGKIISEPFLGTHWSGTGEVRKVMIEFDTLLNPYKHEILHVTSDAELSEQHWTPQKSGISITENILSHLEKKWALFLRSKGVKSYAHRRKIYREGNKVQRLNTYYERDYGARFACLEYYGYKCSVCFFDFEDDFGDIGKNYIHVHHLREISSIGKEYVIDPINDLRPVCPNCHAMLHKKKPAYTIDELKAIISDNK